MEVEQVLNISLRHLETHAQMRLGRRSMALEAENALFCCLLPLSEAVSISVPAGQEIKSGDHGFSRQPGTRGQSCKDSVWVNKEAR